MSELTDLEIGQKIAAINNDDVRLVLKSDTEYETWLYCNESGGEYDPLTDDALCFRFCYEDGISVHYVDCPTGSGMAYFANKNSNSTNYCDTPNRAVCLAKLNIFSE